MEFYMPTHIYSEKNCIEKHGDVFKSFGRKAMIVTGKHSSRVNGSLDAVISQLEKYDIEYVIYDDIEENPSVETVMKARKIGVDEEVEFVIGIGGGSPMDAAKAIALMVANSEAEEDLLFTRVKKEYLPVIEIPTTAGTGSEVTPWSILTIHKKRTKSSIAHSIHPAVALIDAEYLKYAPAKVLVNTAVDTLAHLVESHLVVRSTDYSKFYTREGLMAWGKFKDILKEHYTNGAAISDDDYNLIMEACTLGGIAITHTSTGLPHTLSYTLTYEANIPHGAACGVSLPGFVASYPDREKAKEVMQLLGFKDEEEFKIYLYSIIDTSKVTVQLWEKATDNIMANPLKLATYPEEVQREKIIKFI